MMNIKLTILLLGLYFAAMSYQQGYTIEGEISNLEDGAVVKLSNFDLRLTMDSCIVKDGKFRFSGHVETPHKAIMRVYVPDSSWVMSYNAFYLDNANYSIVAADLESFKSEYLTASEGVNLSYNQLMRMTEDVRQQQMEIRNAKKYDHELGQSLYAQLVNLEKQYLRENTNTFPALDIMVRYAQYLEYHRQNPERTVPMSRDSLKHFYAQLNRKMKKTMKAEVLYSSLYGQRVTGKGQHYMELEGVLTLDEQPFKISDVKTEFVLLDFTGVHCGWCKRFNARILPDYENIKDKIEIVSFYTNTNIDWVRRDIRKNEIPWVVVSDFKGDYSPNKRRYQVQGIPDFFLLDKDRTIIKHQVGYNEEFIQYLVELGTRED